MWLYIYSATFETYWLTTAMNCLHSWCETSGCRCRLNTTTRAAQPVHLLPRKPSVITQWPFPAPLQDFNTLGFISEDIFKSAGQTSKLYRSVNCHEGTRPQSHLSGQERRHLWGYPGLFLSMSPAFPPGVTLPFLSHQCHRIPQQKLWYLCSSRSGTAGSEDSHCNATMSSVHLGFYVFMG